MGAVAAPGIAASPALAQKSGGTLNIETFNGSPREECLNQHWFDTSAGARQLIETWRIDYNVSRPHMALANTPPR